MKMRKALAVLGLALLAGCSESESVDDVCGHGTLVDGLCQCDAGWTYNAAQRCAVCAEGYVSVGNVCKSASDNPDNPDNPGQPSGECTATFYFTDATTSGYTVYLVGDFNGWDKMQDAFKMTHIEGGTHAIKVKVSKGQKIEYKYYVSGLTPESDAWKTDGVDGGNGVVTFDVCGKEVGDSNGQTFTGGRTGDLSGGTSSGDGGECITKFQYYNRYTNVASGGEKDSDVYLVGDFSNWQPTDEKYKMTSDGNGLHTISVNLAKGSTVKYKYYIDGWTDAWQTDRADDGDGNTIEVISACGMTFGSGASGGTDTPVEIVPNRGANLAAAPKVAGKKITFEVTLDDGFKIDGVNGGSGNAKVEGNVVSDEVAENSRYDYRVEVSKGSEKSDLFVPVWVEDTSFDWRDALLYFAFTDRFYNGDTSNDNPATDASVEGTSNARWVGGDFKGLQKKVEEGYFSNLGVNTLWISSVSMNYQGVSYGTGDDKNHSYSAYHSYWPITTFMTASNQAEFDGLQAIEPHFGTMADLRSLVSACHKRGIRVLVDFAANHVHQDSPIFKKHENWFNMPAKLCTDNDGWNQIPESCWFSQDLPDINYGNEEARKQMVDHAIWLIRETGVDGFRVDAVKHMNIQFIKDLRAAVETLFNKTGMTFYMVGETFDGNTDLLNKYIGNDLLHAQFDFPLYFALQKVLENGSMGDVRSSRSSITSDVFKSNLMGTFIGNHDVARALSVAAGQYSGKWGQNPDLDLASKEAWIPYFKVKQALTIILTQPGVPLIYYGDEVGMLGSNDPDNRRAMKFDGLNSEESGMLEYIQKLGKIRAAHKAITRGHREDLEGNKDGSELWCYKMTDGTETIIVGIAGTGVNDGVCQLGSEMKLENLLSDGHEEATMSQLTFDMMSRFQIYLVK